METYYIPSQLDAIRRLPEPERTVILGDIREREANLAFIRETSRHFFKAVNTQEIRAVPEYTMDLGEVVMAVDFANVRDENPIMRHEPVLQALPSYTRVVLLTPAAALSKVKARLHALDLAKRVRLIVSLDDSKSQPREGITRWMRDVFLMARDGKRPVILASLAHKDFEDVSHNDLAYLSKISDADHQLLRMPIFLRGGNLAVARGGRSVLLVGSDELKMNQQWFVDAFGFVPPPNAVQDILKAASGVDEVAVLPNSHAFYHLDMFLSPLTDGKIGLLTPLDPENLDPVDRDVLSWARKSLRRLGFDVISIPTMAERIKNYQSPVNIVPFTDRTTGRRRAMVPMFPEPRGQDSSSGLNAKVLEAYRSAGIDPIPVEDRFHVLRGNIHCATVPMR